MTLPTYFSKPGLRKHSQKEKRKVITTSAQARKREVVTNLNHMRAKKRQAHVFISCHRYFTHPEEITGLIYPSFVITTLKHFKGNDKTRVLLSSLQLNYQFRCK